MNLWAFRMLLFYICIMFVQPQNRYTFLWPLRIANTSFIFAVCLFVLACVRDRQPLMRFGPATILACFLLFFTTLSQFFGVYQISSAWNSYLDIIVKNALLLIMLEAMMTSVKRVWATQMVMLVATLWWVKSGVRLAAAGATYSGDRLMGAGIGMIDNPNSFAYMLCIFIPLYLYAYQQSRKWWERYAFLGVAIAAVFVVLQTGSRTGLVTLIGISIFLLPKYGRHHFKALCIMAISFVFLLPMTGSRNVERFKTIPASVASFFGKETVQRGPMTQDEQSANERRLKNIHTWNLIKEHILFGVGVWPDQSKFSNRYPFATGQVHCEILMAGRQMGLIGMSIYSGFLLIVFWGGRKIQRQATSWPVIADLGWTFQLQAVTIIVGGFFCPGPWHPPMMILVASASALNRLLQGQESRSGLPQAG